MPGVILTLASVLKSMMLYEVLGRGLYFPPQGDVGGANQVGIIWLPPLFPLNTTLARILTTSVNQKSQSPGKVSQFCYCPGQPKKS